MLDNRLSILRPKILEKLELTDKYGYVKLDSKDDFLELRRQFVHGSYLQLVSERSRPEAFIDHSAPEEFVLTDPGIVDIKVVKAGIIYRHEESSKLGLYSIKVWKEWGAILTASQLYLFKDVAWIKASLLSQQDSTLAIGRWGQTYVPESHTLGTSIIRVPIDGFNPSVVVPTKNMVALTSDQSDRHKHSFFVGVGAESRDGSETKDWFAAESHDEMKDWILKINYAASFNTYHVGIHGISNSRDDLKHMRHRSQPSGSSLPDLLKSHSESSLDFKINQNSTSGDDDGPFLDNYASRSHRERVIAVQRKIDKIVKVLEEKEKDLEMDIRNGRHLKLLAPIQPRTRDAVSSAARELIDKLDTSFINRKRLQCYHSLFELDLQVESDFCAQLGIFIDEDTFKDASVSEVVMVDNSNEDDEHRRSGEVVDEDKLSISHRRSISSSPHRSLSSRSQLRSPSRSSSQSTSRSLRAKDASDRGSTESSSIFQTTSGGGLSIVDSIEIMSSKSDKGQDSISTLSASNLKDMLSIPKRSSRSPSPKRSSTSDDSNSDEASTQEKGNQRSVSLLRKTNDFTLLGKKFSVVEVNPEFAATPNHNRSTSQSVTNDAGGVSTSSYDLEPSPSLHSALSSLSG